MHWKEENTGRQNYRCCLFFYFNDIDPNQIDDGVIEIFIKNKYKWLKNSIRISDFPTTTLRKMLFDPFSCSKYRSSLIMKKITNFLKVKQPETTSKTSCEPSTSTSSLHRSDRIRGITYSYLEELTWERTSSGENLIEPV